MTVEGLSNLFRFEGFTLSAVGYILDVTTKEKTMAFPKYVTHYRAPQWQQTAATAKKPATGDGCYCGCLEAVVCNTCHEVFH